jgi:hypothetical protein
MINTIKIGSLWQRIKPVTDSKLYEVLFHDRHTVKYCVYMTEHEQTKPRGEFLESFSPTDGAKTL